MRKARDAKSQDMAPLGGAEAGDAVGRILDLEPHEMGVAAS